MDTSPARSQRTYDHRLPDLVRTVRDPDIVAELGVPRSTALGWLRGEYAPVVTAEVLDMDATRLQAEVFKLRRRVRLLAAIVRLLIALLRAFDVRLDRTRRPEGAVLQAEVLKLRRRVRKLAAIIRLLTALMRALDIRLDWTRLREGAAKTSVLRAIGRAQGALSLRGALRVVRLSPSRYHQWRQAERACELDDQLSCPRLTPTRLSAAEILTIKEMVESTQYRHVPTGRLAILAQRLGRVFAAPATWYKLVRERAWRRPRTRVHPAKPKVGVRTAEPDELWHIDTTVIRLLNGTKVYLHAVIDNFSRRILGWRVTDSFEVATTVAILHEAVTGAVTRDEPHTLVADAGVENVNAGVNGLIESGILSRVLALRDVTFSNSMIEAWWRTLKHQWLFLNTLDSVETVRRLVAFYVAVHNAEIPHSAFRGQTPDEMYYGRGQGVSEKLECAKKEARVARIEANQLASCGICCPAGATTEEISVAA